MKKEPMSVLENETQKETSTCDLCMIIDQLIIVTVHHLCRQCRNTPAQQCTIQCWRCSLVRSVGVSVEKAIGIKLAGLILRSLKIMTD